MLVPCAHFQKQVYATFGIPFYARIKHNEPFQAVKDRLQKKLDIPDKEWEKVSISDHIYIFMNTYRSCINVSELYFSYSFKLKFDCTIALVV